MIMREARITIVKQMKLAIRRRRIVIGHVYKGCTLSNVDGMLPVYKISNVHGGRNRTGAPVSLRVSITYSKVDHGSPKHTHAQDHEYVPYIMSPNKCIIMSDVTYVSAEVYTH